MIRLASGLFATSLLAVSLMACQSANTDISRDEGREMVKPDTDERMVGTQDLSAKDERPAAAGGELDTPEELEPGQPVKYYESQFQRMGYKVVDKKTQNDRIQYDLSQEDHIYQVFLTLPKGEEIVQDVQTNHYQVNPSGKKPPEPLTKEAQQQRTRTQGARQEGSQTQ